MSTKLGIAVNTSLQKVNTENTRYVLQNTDAYQFMLTVFDSGLKLSSGKALDVATATIDKHLSATELVGKGANNENVVISVKAAQIIMANANLLSLTSKTSMGGVVATLGAVFAKKIALAMGAASDDKQAKTIAAIADIAAAGLVVPAAIMTGVGPVMIGLTVVSSLSQCVLSGLELQKSLTQE